MTKVLIVEDDKTALQALCQMVQAAGYTAFIAADTSEAIHTFELEMPGLILVDINLRGESIGQPMDGLGLIDWLKYRHPDHPFTYIIVSGEDLRIHQTRAAATGAFSIVQKPIDADLLLAEIRRAVADSPTAEQPAEVS